VVAAGLLYVQVRSEEVWAVEMRVNTVPQLTNIVSISTSGPLVIQLLTVIDPLLGRFRRGHAVSTRRSSRQA